MPRPETPPPIEVELLPWPWHEQGNEKLGISTEFFRQGCYLPESWELMVNRDPECQERVIKSLGCSIGTEADSTLGIHKKNGDESRINLLGCDINRGAVQKAREGLYLIAAYPEHIYAEGEIDDRLSDLQEYGFAVEPRRVFKEATSFNRPGEYFEVDAKPLREPHDISFAENDLRKEVPGKAADLIFANNLLYWMLPEEATQTVRNIVNVLREGGVLCIGDMPEQGRERMDPKTLAMGLGRAVELHKRGIQRVTTYYDWVNRTAEWLESEFNLVPVPELRGTGEIPTVFTRD